MNFPWRGGGLSTTFPVNDFVDCVMPLPFLKKPEARKTDEPRAERSRVDDRFERHLRLALRDRQIEVRGPAVLNDALALVVKPGESKGTLQKISLLRLDFELLDVRAQTVIVGIVLSSRTYGRDRRRKPATSTTESTQGPAIITVLHLNPNLLTDVLSVRDVLRPYLPE